MVQLFRKDNDSQQDYGSFLTRTVRICDGIVGRKRSTRKFGILCFVSCMAVYIQIQLFPISTYLQESSSMGFPPAEIQTGASTRIIGNKPSGAKRELYPPPRFVVSDTQQFIEFWNQSHYDESYHLLSLSTGASLRKERLLDPPRMLVGIFTGAASRKRREVIRETSLNFHEDMKGYTGKPLFRSSYYRVCSLWEIQTKKIRLEDCLLVYVFVAAGGNENTPTMRLTYDKDTPMVLSSPAEYEEEKDMVFLNIKENMNEGKTPTWFRYASSYLAEEEGLYFDYIAKMDDDTLLFTGNWIDILERELPKPQVVNNESLVYGGKLNLARRDWVQHCAKDFTTCPLVGPVWMIGPFYFLSYTLAAYTSSDVLDQAKLACHEDVATGSYVYSHPRNVSIVQIQDHAALFHYFLSYAWLWHLDNTSFKGKVFAHSEDACYMPTGPYFKRASNVRKVWRQYIGFRWNNQDRAFLVSDIYHLEDHPALDHGEDLRNVRVHPSDYIYSSDDFDASPIVLEDPYNIVFFPVSGAADVVWRCLIRRLLNFKDWDEPAKQFDGLTYLSDYSTGEASAIMSSANFTRAIFVRNPIDRIQSNYIQLIEQDPQVNMLQGCPCSADCEKGDDIQTRCQEHIKNFDNFLTRIFVSCDKPYWRPQPHRMEPKYLGLLDFVGHYEEFSEDVPRMLHQALEDHSTVPKWVNSDEIKVAFDHLDVSYSASSYPDRFPNGTMLFQKRNKIDLRSELLSWYV